MLLFHSYLLLSAGVIQQTFIHLCLLIILPFQGYENSTLGPGFQQEGPEPKRIWSEFLGTQDSIKYWIEGLL